jgi:hypothetical protein
MHWIPVALFPVVTRSGREADQLHLLPRSRIYTSPYVFMVYPLIREAQEKFD